MAIFPYISLFAGVGGLDLAVAHALHGARCVCYVEGEIPVVEILAARIAEGSLDDAPIWSDVRTFDGEPWRGRVDGIIGGFPCQDLSVAGKRAGIDGERSGLWGEFRRIIGEVRPSWVFIENVPGLISSRTLLHRRDLLEHYDRLRDAARTPKARWYVEAHIERLHRRLLKAHGISTLLYVGCQLEEMGYRVEVEEIAASDVGAPHRRERVFVLAVADAERPSVLEAATGGASDTRRTPTARASGKVADAGDGLIPQQGRRPEGRAGPRPAGAAVDDAASPRHDGGECRQDTAPRDEARLREPDRRRDGVADAISPRPQERGRQPGDAGEKHPPSERDGAAVGDTEGFNESDARRNEAGRPSTDRGPSLPLFPHGPGLAAHGVLDHIRKLYDKDPGRAWDAYQLELANTLRWRELLVRRPWLRPAISQAEIESALCDAPDGLADILVRNRTDALRACGNGVVALQGAFALAVLLGRIE